MAAHVNLRISTGKKTGSTWFSALSVEGNKYYYKFTGGNSGNDNGNQAFLTNNSPTSFEIQLVGNTNINYRLVDQFYFYQDNNGQLAGALNADNTVTITDQCTDTAMMLCGVYLHPTDSPHDLFLCDPRIINILTR